MERLISIAAIFLGFDMILKKVGIYNVMTHNNTLIFNKLEEKISKLETRIETLEDFRLKIYDKNFLFTEKRTWEEECSEDYDSEEIE